MRYKIVAVKNVTNLMLAYEALANSSHGVPKMGLVHGVAGAGKTSATILLANRVDAIMVRATPTHTLSSFLGLIMKELGASPMRRGADMVQFIVEQMQIHNRPLFVDEADSFTDPKVRCDRSFAILETLRSIHDLANMPVMLIGMNGIDKELASRYQIMRRLTQWVEFKPLGLPDVNEITKVCCEISIQDDLITKVLSDTGGNVGLLMVALARIENFSKVNGLETIGLREWGNKKFNLRGEMAGGRDE